MSSVERFFSQEGLAEAAGKAANVLVVPHYVMLGQITALRFLEWASLHPEGVIALPTGRTPEYFIKWVQYYLANWKREANAGLLARIPGMEAKPSLGGLRFVQLDEFFPIAPTHERAFGHFVRKFYFEGFGINPAQALTMDTFDLPSDLAKRTDAPHHKDVESVFPSGVIDLGLRVRQPESELELLQQKVIRHFDRFCEGYENTIRSWGGIGFFLGGIGPDGHVAFNMRGASHRSTTRLDKLNYESMATASVDLGGIDAVRRKAVITIGLGTIAYNPDVTAIIMAAGETKARIVADAVESPPAIDYPASLLQGLPGGRFYLTAGAASLLAERRFPGKVQGGVTPRALQRAVIDGAIAWAGKEGNASAPLQGPASVSVSASATGIPEWEWAVRVSGRPLPELLREASESLRDKIHRGLDLQNGQRFLHTAPHHDDIELAYFPLIHHLVRSPRNENHFCYLTSGFTAVTNAYLQERLKQLEGFLREGRIHPGLLSVPARDGEPFQREIHGYLNAIAAQNREAEAFFATLRMYRRLIAHFGWSPETAPDALEEKVHEILHECLDSLEKILPGQRDPRIIEHMKGWLREWEAELVWAHFGLGLDNVHHLRLQFYSSEIFPEDPDFERDVRPILDLMERIRPTVVTLAMDPEGSGPDTHFKCLIALARALEEYVKLHGSGGLRIYGYRNIWARFHPSEADNIVPVSLNSFAVLQNMFETCFASQRTAAFPSPELDGTFSKLAQKIWVEQHQDLIRLFGQSYFYENAHPQMRRTYGALYLKDMSYAEFEQEMAPLKRFLESKKELS